jgi:hypothetical protein
MIDTINAQKRVIDGQTMYPRMFGDRGWYGWTPQPYAEFALELYFLSLRSDDRRRVPADPWLDYVEGRDPAYPEQALRADLARVRQRVAAMRGDPTTPDTRLADDPMQYNPASVDSLVRLMLGGIPPQRGEGVLLSRLRFFDPSAQRAGLPPDVAALVERFTADDTTVTLVNLNQVHPRTLILQAGAYAEHSITRVSLAGAAASDTVGRSWLQVQLEPGCGATLHLEVRRHSHPRSGHPQNDEPPTLLFPWKR